MNEKKRAELQRADAGQTADQKLFLLARKVRRRRMITAAVLILLTAFVTVCLVNYKAAGRSVSPPIVISRDGMNNGQTTTTVFYSLGFKQVVYESEYGRNYSQRLWLWEKVEKNPEVLTAQQYQQLTAQLNLRNGQDPAYSDYFQCFHTFDASILDVKKEKDRYTIYMKGAVYSFLEYKDGVYENVDGDPGAAYDGSEQQPMIVDAVWDGRELRIEQVKEYNLGDAGSAAIYKEFPKPAAVRLNASVKGQSDEGQKAIERSRIKAAAHFGKPMADGTYLFLNDETAELELYRIVPDKWRPDSDEGPWENDILVEKKPLAELKAQR